MGEQKPIISFRGLGKAFETKNGTRMSAVFYIENLYSCGSLFASHASMAVRTMI